MQRLEVKYLIFNVFKNRFGRSLQLALPHVNHPPARLLKLFPFLLVTLNCTSELGGPELCTSLGHGCARTSFMSVPEAAMNEDDSLVFSKDDVRPARKVPHMKAESIARCMKELPQKDFRLGVFAPDPGHVPAAVLL